MEMEMEEGVFLQLCMYMEEGREREGTDVLPFSAQQKNDIISLSKVPHIPKLVYVFSCDIICFVQYMCLTLFTYPWFKVG